MDIVSRLKKFMDFRQIAISQFADSCNIPRPTISQILNGRNKKVSDELIGKIHATFPDLSVVWLMFGEGDMITQSNIKTSEPLNETRLTFDDAQLAEHEILTSEDESFSETTDFFSEKSENDASSEFSPISDNSATNTPASDIAKAISNKIEPTKKITSIVVFYADSTFQTFMPS